MKNIEIVKSSGESLMKFLDENQFTQVAILCDENTMKDCLPLILENLPVHWLIEIKSGEQHKNLETCEQIWGALTEGNFDRDSLLINLGGGVIGDMGGFAASTFKRGFNFLNIPTTLLAQVDASIGGKLGVDFMGLKNHIGLFNEPKKILIDPVFLSTLPFRELRSGFAEIIKHALIADKNYWNFIKKIDLEDAEWEKIVERSIKIKYEVVQQDPLENGHRKVLNFGHTIGHGVESTLLTSPDEKLLHGEAVAVGMICETYLSTKISGLDQASSDEICNFIFQTYDLKIIDKIYFEQIIRYINQDKKNKGNSINASLLKSIGECAINIPISESDILDSLFYFNKKVIEPSKIK